MRKLIAALILLAGCGNGASPPPDSAATRAEIDALIKQYHEKLIRGEIDAVVALLDPEFSISFSGQEHVYGRDASTAVLKGFIDFYKSSDVLGKRKSMFGDVRIRQEGNLAFATYTVAFIDNPDKPPYVETYTHIFKRSSGKWLFLHEQRSFKKA